MVFYNVFVTIKRKMAETRCSSAVLIALLNCAGLSACIGLPQTPTSASAAASVEGVIVNQDLSGVTVRLESTPINPLSYFDGYSATVKADGSFHFEDVAPGAYHLVAEAKPSMFGEYGSRPPEKPGDILQVKPGDRLGGLSLELFPDPKTICGYVVDANGKSVEVSVERYTLGYFRDHTDGPRANLELPIKRSDANGYFSIPIRSFNHESFFIRAGGVWYPSTTDFAEAVPLEPTAQSATGCQANIQIKRKECNLRVTGMIQSALPYPANEYKASLFAAYPTGTLFLNDTHPLFRPDGVDFEGVCAGSYAVVLEHHLNGETQDFASPVFQLKESSVTVALAAVTQKELAQIAQPTTAVVATASVSGNLRLEGLNWNQACPVGVSRQADLIREGDNGGVFPSIDAQGDFMANGLKPGVYRLSFGETAHGAAYIKSFTVDGRSANPAHFTIKSGEAARIEAVFSNNARGALGHIRADYTAEPHYLPNGTHPAASISGMLTGAAADGAKVKLSALRFNSARSTLYQTATSASGDFHFDSVDPGIYELSTKRESHQFSAYGAKGPGLEGMPIVLSAGQHLDGVILQTFPKSSLCGRVLDYEGNPRSGVEVWVEGEDADHYVHGAPTTWQKHSLTDKQGRYTLSGVGRSFFQLWAQIGDNKTYYPSQSDDPQSMYVDLETKDSACVYDIYLPSLGKTQAERGYSVSGTIEGHLDKALGDHFYVNLYPVDGALTPDVKPLEIKAAGAFELQQVWPGSYTLTVTASYGSGNVPCAMPSSICFGYFHYTLASQKITVTSAGLKGLELSIGALPKLDGEVLMDGGEPDAKSQIGSLTLSGEYTGTKDATAKLDSHRHFSFKTLDVWNYLVDLNRYEPHYYVQSIELDGKPEEGRHIQLHYGQSAHLVVRLATDGASGTLTAAPSQPPIDSYRDLCQNFGGGYALILMIPDPLPADNTGIITGTYSTDGMARVSQVPPGHYRILAADNLVLPGKRFMRPPGTVYLSRHDDLVKLAALGMPVEVSANQHFNWSVPTVTEQMRKMLAEEGFPSTFQTMISE
ncbi:MAG: carboxypeptidase-like regulatory domain-containing protein [Terracidiphilus sp.]